MKFYRKNFASILRITCIVCLLSKTGVYSLKHNDISANELKSVVRTVPALPSTIMLSAGCPALPPCYCRPLSGHTDSMRVRVVCDTARWKRRFPKFVKSTDGRRSRVERMSLAYTGLQLLPSGAFRNIEVLELDLQGNNFNRVGSRSFDGLKTLTSLDLSWCNITRVSSKALRGLVLLRNLSLAENRLRRLNSFAFRDLRSLESLSLAGNPLVRIEPDLFRYQSTLQTLDLSYCELGRIPWLLFSGLWGLRSLDLRGNRLRQLPAHSFTELFSLDTLLLADNSLTELDRGQFEGLQALTTLGLDDNRLRRVDPAVFTATPGVSALDLGENRLRALLPGTLTPLTQLRQLSLDGNRLHEIPGDVIRMSQLRRLDVSYNQIQTIDGCLLDVLGARLEYFNMRENPFHCDADCSLQARLRRIYFQLVKRWVVARRTSAAGRRRGHGGRLMKGPSVSAEAPFVPGKCWTPAELRESSIVDWRCSQGSVTQTLAQSDRCNFVDV